MDRKDKKEIARLDEIIKLIEEEKKSSNYKDLPKKKYKATLEAALKALKERSKDLSTFLSNTINY